MNIADMHNVFRTLGQQMGMQLNRGILPESIDIYLNEAIIEKVQVDLLRGVHTALQEGVDLQPSTMATVNTFRTLYKKHRMPVIATQNVNYFASTGYHIVTLPTTTLNAMMYLGFSIEYEDNRGKAISCRLIGSDVIETTLRDYCNGADKSNPIVSLCSDSASNDEELDIYINSPNTVIKYLNIKYIKTPNVVKYDDDAALQVNCDLPAYCHYEIVERAVQKYYASLGIGTGNNQQQSQQNR